MPSTAYEVCFPSRGWFDAEPGMVNAMNTEDSGFRLRLPVSPWPAAYTNDRTSNYLPTFSGVTEGSVSDITGESFDPSIFKRPLNIGGWTDQKFADYVESRENVHVVVDGRLCPTLAFLCWYFDKAAVVSHRQDDHWALHLINESGRVTRATYRGSDSGLDAFRKSYLQDNQKQSLIIHEVELVPDAPEAAPDPWETRAAAVRQELESWKERHAAGTLGAPESATLSAADLDVPADGGEVVARAKAGEHLYELRYPQDTDPTALEVLCTVDGAPRRFSNLVTGVDEGMAAPAGQWAQRILKDTAAKASEPAPKLWETNEADADLYRIVNNIVRYDEHEAATSHFRTSDELQAWLDEALGDHNAPLVVRAVEDVYLVLMSDRMPMYQQNVFDRADSPETKIGYAPRVFHPWKGLENWLNDQTGEFSYHPLLQTAMDGRELQSFTASNCLDWAYLENDLLAGDDPVGPNTWFAIHLAQPGNSRTCIAFPARGSLLSVATDNDGATALIAAREYDSRNYELLREAAFEERWAAWLDEDRQLTPEETAAGLARVKELIEENTP